MKKKCFYSQLTSSHIIGFKAFCNSLNKSNPWLKEAKVDMLIVSVDLSAEEMNYCESLYPHLKWRKKDKTPTSFSIKNAKIGECAFHKLGAFSVYDYDLVISIDCSDMIVIKPIGELFSLNPDIGMVQGWTPVAKWQQYNGGLVLLNKKYRNKKIYEELKAEKPTRLYDQDILNNKFKKNITKIPTRFNFSKRMIECDEVDINDAKILHFVGEKPWEEYNDKEKYKEIEKKWHENN